MNIYLDIDKTLITKDLRMANHLKDFLIKALKKHNVYWLTTHCKGDATYIIHHLRDIVPNDVMELVKQVKPTNWSYAKTDDIDFSKDFIWLDDYIFENEKKVLRKHYKNSSWIQMDLVNNPDQLLDVIKLL